MWLLRLLWLLPPAAATALLRLAPGEEWWWTLLLRLVWALLPAAAASSLLRLMLRCVPNCAVLRCAVPYWATRATRRNVLHILYCAILPRSA